MATKYEYQSDVNNIIFVLHSFKIDTQNQANYTVSLRDSSETRTSQVQTQAQTK